MQDAPAEQFDKGNANSALSDRIAEKCGEVSVGCSDIAGLLKQVLETSQTMGIEREGLLATFESLELGQRTVADASDEARELSRQGRDRLSQSTKMIGRALEDITSLLDLIEALSNHVVGLGAALAQVRTSTSQIEQIAETTSILALNASIEAARAGEQGKTFAVVAGEVKGLAAETSRATAEISETLEKFTGEATGLISRIEQGASNSQQAKSSVGHIKETIYEVEQVFAEVDQNNEQIAQSNGAISNQVANARRAIDSFEKSAATNTDSLENAHDLVGRVEVTASEMFDSVVKAGLAPGDSAMVGMALENRDRIKKACLDAIEAGDLAIDALFDTNYVQIEGSDPPRYRTRLTPWADGNWRPLLDEMKNADPAITAVVCSDINGFLPTHRTERSRKPTGDKAHDDAFCRNGRISIGPMTIKAKQSDDAYQMAVYRHVGDGQSYAIVRNVYVPLIIEGRRWGDVELAYCL